MSPIKNQTIFRLYLESNRITSLPKDVFNGYNIVGLELSFNPLTSVAPAIMVALESSLSYLSLRGTRLNSWPTETLARLKSLAVLDLSDIFTTKPIPIHADTFTGLSRLEELILSNNGLTSIDDAAFSELKSLLVLFLNENKLSYVPIVAPSLVDLSLVGNKLASLTRASIRGLSNLRYLKLSDNSFTNLSSLPKEAFDPVRSKLQTLDIEFNDLRGVPNVGPMRSMKKLNLAGTMVSTIIPGTFSQMSSLQVLDISDNRLEVGTAMFEGLEHSLESLLINRADLESIPVEQVRILNNLRELHVAGNNIDNLRGISQLAAVVYDLEYNQLANIADGVFTGSRAGLILKLSHNKLTNLSFVSDVCRFARLELTGNDLHCDCDVYNLVRTPRPEVIGRCVTPDEFHRMSLKSGSFHDNTAVMCLTSTDVI